MSAAHTPHQADSPPPAQCYQPPAYKPKAGTGGCQGEPAGSGVGWNGMERNGVEWNAMEWNGMERGHLAPHVVVEAGLPNAAGEHGWAAYGYTQHLHEFQRVPRSVAVGVVVEHDDNLTGSRVLREPPHAASPLRELHIRV